MANDTIPAILIAGGPNCGKSVLSFLLTSRLRQLGIDHYLLRSAPDGEGDWFLTGDLDTTHTIRQEKKGTYSDPWVEHMRWAVQNRSLPLLVDIGGKPRGDQWAILRACTHSIVLYRSPQDRDAWRGSLAEMGLCPLAELQSDRDGEDRAITLVPVLSGVIAGLDRDPLVRREGPMLELLTERVKGICGDSGRLAHERRMQAPLPLLTECSLALALDVQRQGENFIWRSGDLARLPDLVQPGQDVAIDGRGPVWLAAALAAAVLPASAAMYDARLGWTMLDPLPTVGSDLIRCEMRPFEYGDWLEIHLDGGVIEPAAAWAPIPAGERGVALSGKLPRWYFARLARHYAHHRPWVGVFAPQIPPPQVIVVHNRAAHYTLGDSLFLPGGGEPGPPGGIANA